MTYFYFARPGPASKQIYAIGKTAQFTLPVIWWAITDRARFKVPRPRGDGMLAGLLFGLFVTAGIITLYFGWLANHPALVPLVSEARRKTAEFGLTTPERFLLFSVFLALIHALLEEYYWRAFVFAELRHVVQVPRAILISSLGFMAHHVLILAVYFPGRFWTMALPFSLGVAAGGAVWAYIYHRFGNLYPAWVSHALVDA